MSFSSEFTCSEPTTYGNLVRVSCMQKGHFVLLVLHLFVTQTYLVWLKFQYVGISLFFVISLFLLLLNFLIVVKVIFVFFD